MDGEAWWATAHGVAKSRTRLSDFTFTFIDNGKDSRSLVKQVIQTQLSPWKRTAHKQPKIGTWPHRKPLEKGKAAHSGVLAWRTPRAVQSMGSQRVRHQGVTCTLKTKGLSIHQNTTGFLWAVWLQRFLYFSWVLFSKRVVIFKTR